MAKKHDTDAPRKSVSPYSGHPGDVKAGHPCHPEIVAACRLLHESLQKHHGTDFSYVILGNGNILSASNLPYGQVTPVSNLE